MIYLVHHDVVHPHLPLLTDFRIFVEYMYGEVDEVVEIQIKVFALVLQIFQDDKGHGAFVVCVGKPRGDLPKTGV